MTSCALAVALVAPASAQTVLIDFGSSTSYRGLSVINPDTNGNYWNSVQPGIFVENLVDLDNAATAIDLGWDTPVGTDSYNGPAGPTGPEDDKEALRNNDLPFTDVDAAALGNLGGALEAVFDFAAGPSLEDNRVRFQIQGLDPARTYDLRFFGSHIFSFDTTTVYSVYTDNTYSALVDMTSLDVQEPGAPNLHNRDRVATISGLSPQTDDILYVQFVGSTGLEGYLNALEIIASAAPALTGDYNNNGQVDAADYTVWRDNLGGTLALPNRDPANIGPISLADYTSWKNNFSSAGSGASATTGVPEPTSILLSVLASIGWIGVGTRRKS